mgnify:CR=1|tara:strand:+ start:629 stop:868 length:240 start_codon:yes stop_codon:yes gene_type:complete
MGNICCFFCRRPRYDKYDVPDNCEEHKGHPSSRGSSYDVINDYHMINGYHIINDYDMINDYPGIERNPTIYKNELHPFK